MSGEWEASVLLRRQLKPRERGVFGQLVQVQTCSKVPVWKTRSLLKWSGLWSMLLSLDDALAYPKLAKNFFAFIEVRAV